MQPLRKASKLILRFSQQKGPNDFSKIVTTSDDGKNQNLSLVKDKTRKFNNVEQEKEIPNKAADFKKKDNELKQGFKPVQRSYEKPPFLQNIQKQQQSPPENRDRSQNRQESFSPQQNQYKQNRYDNQPNQSQDRRFNKEIQQEFSHNKDRSQNRQESSSPQQQNQQKQNRFDNKGQDRSYNNEIQKEFKVGIKDKGRISNFKPQPTKTPQDNSREKPHDQSQQTNGTPKFDFKNILDEDFAILPDKTTISIYDLPKEQQEQYFKIKSALKERFSPIRKEIEKEPTPEEYEKYLVTPERVKESEEEAFKMLKQFDKDYSVLTPEEKAQQEDEEDLQLAIQNSHKGYLIHEVQEHNQSSLQLSEEEIEAFKRFERADPNELQGGQYLEKYLKQFQKTPKEIHISGDLAKLQNYAGSGKYKEMHEVFEQAKDKTQELLATYIELVDNSSNVDNLKPLQKALNQNQKLFKSLDQSYFAQVYEMIFRSKLSKKEMIDYLEWYYQYLKHQKLDQIGSFNILLFENVIDAGVYKLEPKIYKKLPYVFNLYLNEYIESQRGKQIVGFPSLRVLLRIAVDQTIKEWNKDSLKLIRILRQLQQLSQEFIDLSDLARLIQYFTGKQNSLQQIIDIYEQINDQKFIFQLDGIITQHIRDGGIIRCTNNLEEIYKQVDHQNVRKLEIICLLAHKVKEYGIIADIYFKQQNMAKYSKCLSSYIFQICINTVLEQDNSNNNSNAVMSLVNEANSKNVPLSEIFVTMNNMKAQIKDGKYQTAFLLFEKRIIANTILQFQSNKVLRFLLKYLLNQYPEEMKPYTYFRLVEYAQTFVQQLSERQLLQLFLDEKYDNHIFEAILEDESIFQFQVKERKRFVYENIRNQILNGDYNYQKLIGCEDNDDLLLEREIFMNYEQYVEQERQRIFNNRKNFRINYIINQIDPAHFQRRRSEDVYKELFEVFTQEELEQNLMDNDTLEFPELEQVKKFQEFIRPHIKKSLPNETDFDQLPEKDISPQLRKNDQKETDKGKQNIFTPEELELFKHELQYLEDENKLFDDKEAQKKFIRDNIKWEQDEKHMDDATNFQTEIPRPKDSSIIPTTLEEDTIAQVLREHEQNDDDKLKYNPKQLFFFGKLEMIEFWQMKHVYYCPYQYNDHFIFTDPSEFQNEIWDLVAWGIHNQEPMAIKLGEYYSNISGQKIPEHLNQVIGDFYKYQVGHKFSKLRQKWIDTLKVVGKVDYNKVYHKTADNAFLSPQDREVAQWLDTQSLYKPHMRAVMWKDFNPNKYVRYGVTNFDLL